MKPIQYASFAAVIQQAAYYLKSRSSIVHSARWQGSDIANRPEMATHEVAHTSFCVDMRPVGISRKLTKEEWLEILGLDIQPNLPWADDHFEERVCGYPINPGQEWKNWPYARSAASFLDERGKFNHNYMERYWPKLAGIVESPTIDAYDYERQFEKEQVLPARNCLPRHHGIMYDYGDLKDVVELLAKDPYTRQAYLPVWFPEDTGGGSKRAPCTIGYHFIMRDGKLDINYHIRSCDFVRHFRDDLYLTARLLLWVIDRAAELDERWKDVVPGKFIMQIGSLHIFRNDYRMLFGEE